MTDTGIAISLFKTKNRYIERFPLNIDYVELIDRKYFKGWVAGSWTKNNDVVSVDLTRLRINLAWLLGNSWGLREQCKLLAGSLRPFM